MFDIDSITNSLSDAKDNVCLPTLLDRLKDEIGMTLDEINSIKDSLSQVFKSKPSSSDVFSAASSAASSAAGNASMAAAQRGAADGTVSAGDYIAGHTVYNAKVSTSIPEPIMPKSHSPAPKKLDLEKADYTTKEHYPYSDGEVDSSKNWYKVDQKNHFTEHVHSSRSHFKIDEDGNITAQIMGSVKLIIEKDFNMWIKGNQDVIINKGDYLRVKGERIESVHQRVMEKYHNIHVTNVALDRREQALKIYHNSGVPPHPE